jgi:hypothetical protein
MDDAESEVRFKHPHTHSTEYLWRYATYYVVIIYLVQYRTEVDWSILLGWLKDRAAIRTNLTLFISQVPSRQPPYKVHIDGVRRVLPFIVLRIRLDKIHPDFPKSIFHQWNMSVQLEPSELGFPRGFYVLQMDSRDSHPLNSDRTFDVWGHSALATSKPRSGSHSFQGKPHPGELSNKLSWSLLRLKRLLLNSM